jgi:hypothetical protein
MAHPRDNATSYANPSNIIADGRIDVSTRPRSFRKSAAIATTGAVDERAPPRRSV